MKWKRILKAAFHIRNIALLAGVVIVAYLTEYMPFALVGAAGYLFFVLQTLRSMPPEENEAQQEKIDDILELDSRCGDLYREVRSEIGRPFQKKVEEILQDKEELMELFRNDQGDYVRQKLIEQVLKLVMAYIGLIAEFSRKRGEVASFETGELNDGINANIRKLNSLKDPQAIEDMKRAIDLDRKILGNIDEQKRDLEKMGARLTYIESTLKTFKHQIQTSENTDETSTEVDNIINEAAALDHVLNESRKDRVKL